MMHGQKNIKLFLTCFIILPSTAGSREI